MQTFLKWYENIQFQIRSVKGIGKVEKQARVEALGRSNYISASTENKPTHMCQFSYDLYDLISCAVVNAGISLRWNMVNLLAY